MAKYAKFCINKEEMYMDNIEDEQLRRRARVKRLKKAIIFFLLFIILLPTFLCIILFARMRSYDKRIDRLQQTLEHYVELSENLLKAQKTDNLQTNNRNDVVSNTKPDTTKNDNPSGDNKEPVVSDKNKLPENYNEKELVDKALADGRKVVYLTFDDGPSENTGKLLDVLDKYNVKVTFFVNGFQGYDEFLNEIVKRKHTIASHTFSHDYQSVYSSVENFAKELADNDNVIYNATGVHTKIFRFPGGSSNLVSGMPIRIFIDYLNANEYIYFDWNVSSGDGGDGLTADDVYNNVINGIQKKDVSIVLMHDSVYRGSTFEAVPKIIEKLQEMDALILPITKDTDPVHHNIN